MYRYYMCIQIVHIIIIKDDSLWKNKIFKTSFPSKSSLNIFQISQVKFANSWLKLSIILHVKINQECIKF